MSKLVATLFTLSACLSALTLSGCDQREERLNRANILKDAAIAQMTGAQDDDAEPDNASTSIDDSSL